MDTMHPNLPVQRLVARSRTEQALRLAGVLLALLLAGLALALLLGGARPAAAAGEVGNGTPESCTYNALIAAMQGAGLVTFNCGPLPHTIVITYPDGVQPLGGQHTTLDGGGLITLSGNNTERLFHVFPNTYFTLTHITLADGFEPDSGGALLNDGVLVLDDVTIRNSVGTAGGAIYNNVGAMLIVSDAILRDNRATFGTAGAIQNSIGAQATIVNSQFISNTSQGLYSGAIHNRGHITLTGGLLSGNVLTFTGAAPGTPFGGGAIANLGDGRAVLSGVTFDGNRSSYAGGAVFNSGTLIMTEGVLNANSADTDGGGLYNLEGSAALTGTTLSGNTVRLGSGGGVNNQAGSLRLADVTLSGNAAPVAAAGLVSLFGTVQLIGGAVVGNESNGLGAGLYFDMATAHITRTLVAGNASSECAGILSDSGTLSVFEATVSGNQASDLGGGVCAIGLAGEMRLASSTISGNSAKGIGGGVYTWAPSAVLINSTLTGNSAASGGGLYNDHRVALLNVTVSENTASSGGGLFTGTGHTTTLTNTVIAHSLAGGDCGGAAIAGAQYSLASDGTCGLPPANNFNNTDPMLSALGNYGGPTLTYLPRLGSPLINGVVGPEAPATDQRGYPRPVGGAYDIGAVERQPDDTDLMPRVWMPLLRR